VPDVRTTSTGGGSPDDSKGCISAREILSACNMIGQRTPEVIKVKKIKDQISSKICALRK